MSGSSSASSTGAVQNAAASRRQVITLIPNSSIQFLDFTLNAAAAAAVTRQFLELSDQGDPALYSILLEDGVAYHPVTGEIADPSRMFGVTGEQALAPFLNSWLPVPLMRLQPAGAGEPLRFDEGPSNWARLFVAPKSEAAGAATGGYHVVLALDTACEPSRKADQLDAAPSLEDATAGAGYRFSSDECDIAWFVSEAWVDDWLKEVFRDFRSVKPSDASPGAWQPGLDYLASYLTLLSVIEACDFPEIRFAALQSDKEPLPVDLALDIGFSRTSALLGAKTTARDGDQVKTGGQSVRCLPLRDLSEPWRIHTRAFTSRIEFAAPFFGKESHSRLSGRTNAFYWPSLVRVGAEAERLSAAKPTTDDATGLSSPMRYLWDDQPAPSAWRFSRNFPGNSQRGALVCGHQLALVTDEGAVIPGQQPIPIKPRFSRASLSTFMIAELLAQAFAAINAPDARGRGVQSKRARRLGRIVVTTPGSMLTRERAELERRIKDAIELVHSSPHGSGDTLAKPVRPLEVVFASDNATNAMRVFIQSEIVQKFNGRCDDYFDLMGKQRLEHRSGPSMRLACLDIGGGSTNLSIVTFGAAAAVSVAGTIDLVEGARSGGDDIAKAIVERHVLPAIEHALQQCRLTSAPEFLAAILGGRSKGRPAWVGGFGRRFAHDLAYPLGIALIKTLADMREDAADTLSRHTIGTLLAGTGANAATVIADFDDLAADEGAVGFSCLSVPITVLNAELRATADGVLRPLLANAAILIEALDCDGVLLTGWICSLPIVLNTLVESCPKRSGHIVQLAEQPMRGWNPLRALSNGSTDTKPLAALGALMSAVADPAIQLAKPHAAVPAIIGRMTAQGDVNGLGVIFAEQRLDEMGRANTVSFPVEVPCTFGVRRLQLETWPAIACYQLDLAEPMLKGRLARPVKVTIERKTGADAEQINLTLVKATDLEGVPLARKDLSLRFQTLAGAKSYWLDSGAFTPQARS